MTRPYRPSNGSEVDGFMSRFCFECKGTERHVGSLAEDNSCRILDATFWLKVDDPHYPKEWIADDAFGTNARCTAFEAQEPRK